MQISNIKWTQQIIHVCVCVYANKCLCACVNNNLRTMNHNLKTNSADTRGEGGIEML